MGFSIKFNWVLQIDPPESLVSGNVYSFKKSEYRVFPLDVPIDLIDRSRAAIAKIKIQSFTNENGETFGLFETIKIYSGEEKSCLTNYWKENE